MTFPAPDPDGLSFEAAFLIECGQEKRQALEPGATSVQVESGIQTDGRRAPRRTDPGDRG
jgi:hypothetical protein